GLHEFMSQLQRKLDVLHRLRHLLVGVAAHGVLKVRPSGSATQADDGSSLDAALHDFVGAHVGMGDEAAHDTALAALRSPITSRASSTSTNGLRELVSSICSDTSSRTLRGAAA